MQDAAAAAAPASAAGNLKVRFDMKTLDPAVTTGKIKEALQNNGQGLYQVGHPCLMRQQEKTLWVSPLGPCFALGLLVVISACFSGSMLLLLHFW